jgi:multidrug efflux pump subunit AcrB
VPLSSLVTLSEVAEPGSLNRFNRLRAITLAPARADRLVALRTPTRHAPLPHKNGVVPAPAGA